MLACSGFRKFGRTVLALLVAAAVSASAVAADASRPHMVLFLADDLGWSHSSAFSRDGFTTPHMQRMARDGLTFTQAFVASPSCAPSRAALLTGLSPARNGAMFNHTVPDPSHRRWPAWFQELGYEVAAIGKVAHYATVQQYGFDFASHFKYHQDDCIDAAVKWLEQRRSSQPLCLLVGTNWPHVPWPDASAVQLPPLPPNLVDTLQMRQGWARYGAAVALADRDLGQIYDAARKLLGDNTLFLFTSDHGAQLPFGKWNCYDAGIRTPLIAVWPGKIAAGSRTDALVSWVDLLPTCLEAAGGTPPPSGDAPGQLTGRSFLGVLRGEQSRHRDAIFASHSGDGAMNEYPIRAVRTRDWKYIRNLTPHAEHHTHIDKAQAGDGRAYWDSWIEHAQSDSAAAALVARYHRRPAEELYDLHADPYEQRNLAGDPAQAQRLAELRAQLDAWMLAQGDSGLATEELRKPKPQATGNKKVAQANTGAPQPADLVVLNGKVITLDGQSRTVEAVAIRDERIAFVGSSVEARKLVGRNTRVVDARGRAVVPGLIETHVHATGAARGEAQQPFVQLGSIAEIQEWVRREAAKVSAGTWIRLPRVDVTRIAERRMPTRGDLDAAAPHHPAVFNWQYANRQVQILNTAALAAAGITKDTQPPERGRIVRDDAGELTGVLEDCGALTARFLPSPSVSNEAYLDSLVRLLRLYNSKGITSIGERGSNAEGFRTYQTLKSQNRLPVRATVTIRVGTDNTLAGAERLISALTVKPGEGDDWVKVGPLKIGVDGGVLYGTAFLRDPYGEQSFSLYRLNDPQYRGLLQTTPERVTNFVRAGHKLGWQCSSHVTGDAGVDAVLDAVEAANADSSIAGRRFTLIHAYFPNPQTAQRAARLGVCVDTQPAWYYKDGDALGEALGAKRMEQFIGVQVWRDAGVKVALNSDHMQGFGPQTSLNPYDPFLTMFAAVTRQTEGGQVFGADQRVSREAALRMLTSDAAWLSFDEGNRGTLEVGKLGDLAVLSDDPLTCDDERLPEIHAVVTVVGGNVVYEAAAQ